MYKSCTIHKKINVDNLESYDHKKCSKFVISVGVILDSYIIVIEYVIADSNHAKIHSTPRNNIGPWASNWLLSSKINPSVELISV